MDFESYARRFLAHFGVVAQCDKLIEEVLELVEAIINSDGLEACVSEFSDIRNMLSQLEVYVADRSNISLQEIDALIVGERPTKNIRTDDRIESGYYENIQHQRHKFIDIGHLSQGDQQMIENMIETCGRKR